MKSKHFNILIIALSIHIFSVQTRLLYYLNSEISTQQDFSYLNFDEPTILAMVFALAYSVATASVIFITNKKILIFIYGILDSIGVLLYYFADIPIKYGAFYFALYTGILIVSTMYLNGNEYLSDKIIEMKEKGLTQREVAERLNISESKVSRVVNRVKSPVS